MIEIDAFEIEHRLTMVSREMEEIEEFYTDHNGDLEPKMQAKLDRLVAKQSNLFKLLDDTTNGECQ